MNLYKHFISRYPLAYFARVFSSLFRHKAYDAKVSLQERRMVRTDLQSIPDLAALAMNARHLGNEATFKGYLHAMADVAQRQNLSPEAVRNALARSIHPTGAEDLAERVAELRDAKRPQNQPQQAIWQQPLPSGITR